MSAALNDCKRCPAKAGQHHKMSCAVGGAYRRIEADVAPVVKPAKAISFNPPMVRAILDGRKTMTRRPLDPQPPKEAQFPGASFGLSRAVADGIQMYSQNNHARLPKHSTDWELIGSVGVARDAGFPARYRSPHKPGDRLWVREKARVVAASCDSEMHASGVVCSDAEVRLGYEADGALSDWLPYPRRLKPVRVGHCIPNGCYREAARTFLAVTSVRVERSQDISEADAIAEGMPHSDGDPDKFGIPTTLIVSARDEFRRLWTSIYGPDAWDRNEWVWVTEFEVEK